MAASAQSIALQLQKLSNEATEKSFKYNAQEANSARSWQKMMSDTAHQREVADLKEAGLNPVLSTNSGGAQSYTTSAASAQAENAANAVGNVWSSQIGADATRAAAAQSAAATRAAAAQQAAAARYAASLQYAASTYHSDKALEAAKYKSKTDYKIAMNKPVTNPVSLVDKYFGSSAKSQGKENFLTRLKSVISPNMKAMQRNPNQYFYEPKSGTLSANNFQLNTSGVRTVRSKLSNLGISATPRNINLYTKAYIFGDQTALKSFTNMYLATKQSQKQAIIRLNSAWKISR